MAADQRTAGGALPEARPSDEGLQPLLELLHLAKKAAQVGIHDYDPVSGTIRADERVRELWGVAPTETFTYQTFLEGVHPEDRVLAQTAVERALEPSGDGRYAAEYRVRGRGGGPERWISAYGQVLFSFGRAVRLVGTVKDITEHKRLDAERERLLREAQHHAAEMDAIFESIADGLVVCGPMGEVIRSNMAVEEVLGVESGGSTRSIQERLRIVGIQGEDGRPLAAEETANQRALRGEVVRGMTQLVQRADGKSFFLSVSAAPIRAGARAEIVGAVVSFSDRTEERHALDALREASRRKDEFLGMLSHELRNPLGPLRNSAFILEHADPAGEQAARARAIIRRQTEHLARLVDDLLDITRIGRGKIELRRSYVDLREVVLRTADDFRAILEKRRVEFRTAISETKIWIDADPTRIAQVIGNLLHNAAKFTPRGGAVTLSLQVSGGVAEVEVRDTGVGIEPAVLPNVFDAFVQGERTLARSEGGLGLGLALVKGITELHGGTIRAESAGRGRGASFVVALPLAQPAALQDAQRGVLDRAMRARRVLIVEDNPDAAESLAEVVSMLGHTVEVAYDGPSAIEKVRASPPDLVLCDIGLPGMSGYEVARALRADGVGGMQLVAVSGYARPEEVQKALEAGFDAHVRKPADTDQIQQLLASGAAGRT